MARREPARMDGRNDMMGVINFEVLRVWSWC